MKKFNTYFLFFILFLSPLFLKATTIPFELIDGKIIVKVTIKNNQHNFIFDSGAFTIISPELKDKMNAKKSNIVFEGVDANAVKSKMDVFSTNNLQISGLIMKDVNFSFADVSWMSSRACQEISGILGANMMKGKIWQLDFKHKTITVSDKPNEKPAGSVEIPFSEENFTSVPKINAKIRSQNIEFIFDTGSGMGFTINQKSYDLIKDNDFLTFEGLLAQSLNSTSKGERQVDLMEVEISNINLGNQIVDSNFNARNLLGTRFMENYLVDLDFINKRIILHTLNKTPEYSTFGIALAPIKDDLVIVNKLQIPELGELKLTEKIIKINDIDVSKINNETFCEVKKILDTNDKVIIENVSGKKYTLEKKNVLRYLN